MIKSCTYIIIVNCNLPTNSGEKKYRFYRKAVLFENFNYIAALLAELRG